jgi:hypothetical protein
MGVNPDRAGGMGVARTRNDAAGEEPEGRFRLARRRILEAATRVVPHSKGAMARRRSQVQSPPVMITRRRVCTSATACARVVPTRVAESLPRGLRGTQWLQPRRLRLVGSVRHRRLGTEPRQSQDLKGKILSTDRTMGFGSSALSRLEGLGP